ncbi:MAG: DNA mismatch repair endonuclease MutL [Crocinitomicaceae bacterium]|nr:DNA mismatch repair endonuclease MutL [Crocinitomicaceae bacterium]
MSEVIKLLPDHIANQIAAGEVVQRPASVLKELVENSIDAGSSLIQIHVKDGGKTLVHVIDNGCGMSEVDARMSFERHATSKIKKADDLFELSTKGFRGEALASIAAIAHVTLKTRLHDEELGTEIINEGSKITQQEPTSCQAGTSIAVKNLFFNVPARRNFLGQNNTEYRKVLDEFHRIALAHPDVEFILQHNGDEIYNLKKSNLRQRIVQIFGKNYNQRLVPINEETDIVKITGYVVKPEYAKNSKDQTFFFVNNRFFKDRYFHHAVMNAYEGLIPSGKHVSYFLFFDVPTKSIDVNVHPTKTEIKFEENRPIYAILRSSVKQGLGQYNIAPTIDFDPELGFNPPPLKKGETVAVPEVKFNPDYNPFKSTENTPSKSGTTGAISSKGFSKLVPDQDAWENFYGDAKEEEENQVTGFDEETEDSLTITSEFEEKEVAVERKQPIQINAKYILSAVKSGFILIDQYRAHFRIRYDEMTESEVSVKSQKLLFPEYLEIDKFETSFWLEIIPELEKIGFELKQTEEQLEIIAVPIAAGLKNPKKLLEEIALEYHQSEQIENTGVEEMIRLSAASALARKGGELLTTEEMNYVIDTLFASSSPQIAPNGKKIIETITLEEIAKRFS